jgi:hypothetical protein
MMHAFLHLGHFLAHLLGRKGRTTTNVAFALLMFLIVGLIATTAHAGGSCGNNNQTATQQINQPTPVILPPAPVSARQEINKGATYLPVNPAPVAIVPRYTVQPYVYETAPLNPLATFTLPRPAYAVAVPGMTADPTPVIAQDDMPPAQPVAAAAVAATPVVYALPTYQTAPAKPRRTLFPALFPEVKQTQYLDRNGNIHQHEIDRRG